MKKILLLLAFALMASTSFVSNAGRPVKPISGGLAMPTSPMDIVIISNSIHIGFMEKVVSASIKNINTGERYSDSYCPSRDNVSFPFSRNNGTWEITAVSERGILLYRRFYFSGNPNSPQYPIDWIDVGDPVIDLGGDPWD